MYWQLIVYLSVLCRCRWCHVTCDVTRGRQLIPETDAALVIMCVRSVTSQKRMLWYKHWRRRVVKQLLHTRLVLCSATVSWRHHGYMFAKGLLVRAAPFIFPERGVDPPLPQNESAFKMNGGWDAGRVVGCVSRPGIAIVVFVVLIVNLCTLHWFKSNRTLLCYRLTCLYHNSPQLYIIF